MRNWFFLVVLLLALAPFEFVTLAGETFEVKDHQPKSKEALQFTLTADRL